ncbi:MAG: hypothetical protein IJ064_06330 [Bacteroidaceae bacterium]|nr:hypothetical protein [Bacteroidaceae bacterium]
MRHTLLTIMAVLLTMSASQSATAQTRIGEKTILPACEYLNTELDGSLTVRSYGDGKRHKDAREQARKNAVYQIMFKGLQAKGQTIRPLVNEANAYERHEAYFGTFFADGGTYSEYATSEDEKFTAKKRDHGRTQNIHGAVVRVKRSELKARLIRDGILPPEK